MKAAFVRFIYRLKILPRWAIVSLDLIIVLFCTLLGYLLRFNFSMGDVQGEKWSQGIMLQI